MLESQFQDNYHGILRHDGCVMVAKTNITAKIKYVGKNDVLVQGSNKSYVANIHKHLYPQIQYLDIGDTAFIKWRKGIAWLVGYRKKNYDRTPTQQTGDNPVSENQDWITFFDNMELGE